MAVNERTFSRILPESTGDRIGFLHTWDIEYKDKIGNFVVGDTVVDGVSGLTGRILKDTVDNSISTSGVLSITLLSGFELSVSTLDSALNVDSIQQATTVKGYCIYVGKSTLFGFNNPNYGQHVNVSGEASVTFEGGSPQFDAGGKMRVSEEQTLAEHVFTYGIHADEYTDVISGAGTITHLVNSSGILLSIGTTSGDKAERITNKYYKCQAGKGQFIEIVCAIGDEGKADVKRYWGYGDSDNGVFFRLEGTAMRIMLRSSVTGTKVETIYEQADWNHDVLDGSGSASNLSYVNLDVSKVNVWWIDIGASSGGRIRFGIVIEGKRILLHDIETSNGSNLPALSTSTLPLHLELENTGTSASSSEMRIWATTVKTEGSFEPPVKYFANSAVKSGVTSRVALITYRSTQTFNGVDNRIVTFLDDAIIHSSADLLKVEIIKNATLGGTPSYSSAAVGSSVESDTAGTTVTGGTVIHSTMISSGGIGTIELDHVFNYEGESMTRKAAILADPDTYTIAITAINAVSTKVDAVLNWSEIR